MGQQTSDASAVSRLLEWHDSRYRLHPPLLAISHDPHRTRALVSCVNISHTLIPVSAMEHLKFLHLHLDRFLSFLFSSEAVCTPFASSIISDYFQEVCTHKHMLHVINDIVYRGERFTCLCLDPHSLSVGFLNRGISIAQKSPLPTVCVYYASMCVYKTMESFNMLHI